MRPAILVLCVISQGGFGEGFLVITTSVLFCGGRNETLRFCYNPHEFKIKDVMIVVRLKYWIGGKNSIDKMRHIGNEFSKHLLREYSQSGKCDLLFEKRFGFFFWLSSCLFFMIRAVPFLSPPFDSHMSLKIFNTDIQVHSSEGCTETKKFC